MFEGATSFNGNISTWNLANATGIVCMFKNATSFNQDISGWTFPKISVLNEMFYGASYFNQDISSWDVSNIQFARHMFKGASSFNQDISSWDVSNIKLTEYMFYGAVLFNQDISRWNISNVIQMSKMLPNTSFSTVNYDKLLNKWADLAVERNVKFSVGETKYTANAMLATKISFINDIANLCEIVGADVTKVREGIGSDSRIGNKFIYAGAGYGGSCFPKDVKALIKTADNFGHSLEVLKAVERVNDRQKSVVFTKMNNYFEHDLKGKKIALWGLSFKPNTDDMRDAPSRVIIKKLLEEGASVVAYDPVAIEEAKRILGDKITYSDDPYEAVIDADALVVITEWSEFRNLKYKILDKLMKNKVIFDGRNIYDGEEVRQFGFDYFGIGKK